MNPPRKSRKVEFRFPENADRRVNGCTCGQGESARVMPWQHDPNCPIRHAFEENIKQPLALNADFVNRVLLHIDTSKALKDKSNRELADILLNDVWAYLPAGPLQWLFDEIIERIAPEMKHEPDEAKE